MIDNGHAGHVNCPVDAWQLPIIDWTAYMSSVAVVMRWSSINSTLCVHGLSKLMTTAFNCVRLRSRIFSKWHSGLSSLQWSWFSAADCGNVIVPCTRSLHCGPRGFFHSSLPTLWNSRPAQWKHSDIVRLQFKRSLSTSLFEYLCLFMTNGQQWGVHWWGSV